MSAYFPMITGVLLFLHGCSPDWTYLGDDQYVLNQSHANVLREFQFLGEEAPGVVQGFDLDNVSSGEGDPDSCGHGDLIDPEGREGIDNQLAAIWALLEPLVGEAVQALLQGSINEGRFLLMVEMVGVQDLHNDKNVTLNLFQGRQDPEVGTFGLISPDQTYYLNDSVDMSTVKGVSIDEGWVEAGPVAFQLPIDILEAQFVMNVQGGKLRFQIHEDGTIEGIIGGSLSVYDVLEELYNTNAAEEAELVTPLFVNNADMALEDGLCRQMSVAFGFTGTTGYVIREK